MSASPRTQAFTTVALGTALSVGAMLLGGCGLVLDSDPTDSGNASLGADSGRGDSSQRDSGEADSGGRDTGQPDSRACAPVPESCNSRDDDCDGITDETFDVLADVSNCGGCGVVCPSTGGIAYCNAGACHLSCDDGRADCDGDAATGCEGDLTEVGSCGGCLVDCEALGFSLCSPVAGGYACENTCDPGLTDCGGTCADISSDPSHCGGCGAACFRDLHGRQECLSGTCVVVDCGDGRRDCDGSAANGCEAVLGTNANCSACGDACEGDETCTAAGCAPAVLCPAATLCTVATPGAGCRLTCSGRVLTCDSSGTCSCSDAAGGTDIVCPPVPAVVGCDPCEQAFGAGCCGST